VGANSIITADVTIGNGTRILNNVVIEGPVTIGKSCVVKDGAVIGSEGYGFVEDEEGRLLHPPQFGRIVIGDRVWVGSNSTIERAMLTDTIIEDDVKLDDLVHVGSGSIVGRKSMITAGSVIAYDVAIGEGVTLSPNVAVREGVTIAARVVVGQGASVVSNLMAEGVYVGVPAKLLSKKG
jgi:UDP-3-O-[3-hydroxymyristoyl] glucosamine N-acyltransferase